MSPSDAVIAITHRCNARCSMCSVWQSSAADRLSPGHLAGLPRSLRTVNITGGEPFLHPQLPDFVSAVRRRLPRAITTISTNGLLPDRIRRLLSDLVTRDPRLRIAVSIDGLEETHDLIRGLPGSFPKALQTIEYLRSADFPGLRLSMTLSRQNSDQLLAVADLARHYQAEFGIVPAHASEVHFLTTETAPPHLETLLPQLHAFISQLLLTASPKLWLRAHFAHCVSQYLTGTLTPFPCQAGSDFFFLQADGTIYPCNVCSKTLGNIIEQDFADIWHSPTAQQRRRDVLNCKRLCWMVCTARSYYRTHPLQVALWILAHKFRAHLQKPLPSLQPPPTQLPDSATHTTGGPSH